MSDKYIIRNCPALVGCRVEQDLCYKNGLHKCQDCTDCVLKQIVDKCSERYVGFLEESFIKDEILNLLQIEVIE